MVGQGSCATGAAACIAVDQALAFVNDRLIPGERAAIEHRIDACPACRAVVAEVARSAGSELVRDTDGRAAVRRTLELGATVPSPHLFAAPTQRIVGDSHRAARRPQAVLVDDAQPTHDQDPRDPPRTATDRDARRAPGAAVDQGLAAGEIVGRYVVERPLGAGGMGVVSLAHDPELRRPVVIKLVHPNMGFGEGGDELEARLRREAQAMAQLSHGNVVQIFDIGRRGDRVFLAMEFIAGHTLDGWLRERPRAAEEILAVFRQAGAGLAAAHRAGLVHRDFKPSNVLVGADGIVKVTDFGLARSFTGTGPGPGPGPGPGSDASAPGITRQFRTPSTPSAPRLSGVHAVLTAVDSVVGTPAYMAPEQAAGRATDSRTDQYTFAVTLLDALLGQSGMRRAVPPEAPPPDIDAALERARIAAPIRAAILRALAVDPAARFPAIDELLAALAVPAPAPAPSPRRRTRPVAVGFAALVLCGGAAAVWFSVGRPASPPCTATAPARWAGPPRTRVIAALAAAPRPFAGWDAERIAGAIDAAVDALGAAELARCNGAPFAGSTGLLAGSAGPLAGSAGLQAGTAGPHAENAGSHAGSAGPDAGSASPLAGSAGPLAGSAGPQAGSAGPHTGNASPQAGSVERLAGNVTTAACIEHRTAALIRAIDILSASPPPDDLWGLVRAIEQCDPPNPATAALRGRLHDATAAQARGIADAATQAGDEFLAADAFELAGLAALAAGDAAAADAALFAMKQAGERAGNDAPRGRALLHLINAARWSGKYADARRSFDELGAMLDRHGHLPREELAVALVAGDAFIDLGDVAAAFAAWDRAGPAATTLADRDAALTAALGHAWSTFALRLDPAAARAEATAALAAGTAASPAARAPTLGIAADLAIAAGDATAAMTALAESHRLVPARAHLLADRLRTQRARALLGQVDDVVAGLVPDPSDDALAAARIDITRGKILLAADHANEARDVLAKVSSDLRGYTRKLAAMAVPERTDLELAVCDAELAATDNCKTTYRIDLLITALHPRAPVRARLAIIEASGERARQSPSTRSHQLSAALDILVEAQAEGLHIAELRWQIAQLGAFRVAHDHAQLARDARAVFDAAGRADDVAAIDRWLTEHPAGSPPVEDTPAPPDAPPEPAPAKRDPWGPQP